AQDSTASSQTSSLDSVGGGSLLFRTTTPGRYIPAPLILTEVDVKVSGIVARVELRQYFKNPSDSWLEGLYAFPLPENAAVDQMRLQVGEQEIVARIAERKKARELYEKAKSDGKRAALIEQHRPNIFTNAVANIGPGQTVSVTLRYHQTLRYDHGAFELRFPMVVAPRYTPTPALRGLNAVGAVNQNGWVPESPPESPIIDSSSEKINPVAITIALDAGFPLNSLESAYHQITSGDWSDGVATITLADNAVPADRDFKLTWTPKTGAAPVAGVFKETVEGDTYLLAMVLPPAAPTQPVPPRDIIFVLDRSGSMGGTSIRQAQQALTMALKRLRPVDRFDIIRFSSGHDSLFNDLRYASPENIRHAQRMIQSTNAEGGTNMAPALDQALSTIGREGVLKQVVFLTDGAVGNENDLVRIIEQKLGDDRLFTVGIGSAPNSYFMRRAAQMGRGSFTFIGDQSEVAKQMTALFEKLERPALTNLSTSLNKDLGKDSQRIEFYPKLIPDLYHSEPVIIVAKLSSPPHNAPLEALNFSGDAGGRPWRRSLSLSGAPNGAGISAIWGRSKIQSLLETQRREGDSEAISNAVLETALRHHLLSPYTSLVAVQNTVARDVGLPLAVRKAPINLPQGWR
ncbi:MAG: marine proteobacterial sortase target protein, partial [Alphaproteobacteria bacterium]